MPSKIPITLADNIVILARVNMTLLTDFIIILETVFAIVANMDFANTLDKYLLLEVKMVFVNFGMSLSKAFVA